MKKIISLLLSFVMLACIATTESITAFAGGWMDNVKEITFDTTYTELASVSDDYYDVFKFKVPCTGKVSIYAESEEIRYFKPVYANGDGKGIKNYRIYSENDVENPCWQSATTVPPNYSESKGLYYVDYDITLSQGTYYLVIEYICLPSQYNGVYDIIFKFTPSISAPSNFKVSTRNTTSLKLSWSKVGGVSGYQLQQKSGDTWKTKVTTSSTSATLSKLTAGKSYSFRVRAYKTINGTKYYSSWKTLTTCTKPAKVTLSKLTAYSSGHKIKASWKKVSGYAGGYQIYWAKDKSFKKVVAKTTVSGQSKTSYTGKNFTKGKKYYVKVRAYKVVNGTKYYGSWSNVKSITCK